jgi:hypothetical protein
VSVEAKSFIRGLLNPDPGMRPGAAGALGDPVRLVFFSSCFFPPPCPRPVFLSCLFMGADCFWFGVW